MKFDIKCIVDAWSLCWKFLFKFCALFSLFFIYRDVPCASREPCYRVPGSLKLNDGIAHSIALYYYVVGPYVRMVTVVKPIVNRWSFLEYVFYNSNCN